MNKKFLFSCSEMVQNVVTRNNIFRSKKNLGEKYTKYYTKLYNQNFKILPNMCNRKNQLNNI